METPNLGSEEGVTASKHGAGRPPSPLSSEEEKATVVKMMRMLRAELGTSEGAVKRVADEFGYGVESERT